MEEYIELVRRWASNRAEIKRVWFYGSRVKGLAGLDSDLDIAIDLCSEYGLADFICEKPRWLDELSPKFPHELDIKFYEDREGCICREGVESASILVYEKVL